MGDSSDEPWEIRGSFSTTDHGQKHWQPHYFNHAFWSQVSKKKKYGLGFREKNHGQKLNH